MARARRQKEPREPRDSSTVQEDESDIIEEAGAETDDVTGELVIDEATVRELGAVDATSVRENRRLEDVVKRKRAGEKDVPFNTKDPIVIYDTLLRYWTPDSIAINVKRLLGGAQAILNHPVNGAALYEALMNFHGQHAETEYEVKFTSSGRYQGIGRITLRETRQPAQQGQPVQQPPPLPPGYPPHYATPYVAPVAPAPVAPAAPPFDPMAMMSQMFEMFQRMQQQAAPPPPQQFHAPAPPPVMPPMPSPQASTAEMMDWMNRAFGMFQQLATPQTPIVAPAPPVQPAAPPSAQSNIKETMSMMTQMFELFQRMQGPPGGPGPERRGGPFRPPPRPGYSPQGDPSPYPPYQPHQPPPPPQKTLAEQLRESISVIRTASDMANEVSSMFPGQQQSGLEVSAEDDDSPMRVIEAGPVKIVVNKDDGSTRPWETGLANLDKVFKWVGEQHEMIQKAHKERQRPQQLPAGYVEVGPGYRPPPGYVAVPVDENDLPPPPEEMPPPIEEPPSRRAWGAPPSIPEREDG